MGPQLCAIIPPCGTKVPQSRCLFWGLLRVRHGSIQMKPFSLFSRRVPLTVSLSIIVACALVGFLASTMRPVNPLTGARQAPVVTSTVEQPRRINEMRPPADLTRRRVAPAIGLPPLNDVVLPLPSFPAPAGLERDAQGINQVVKLRAAESPPQPERATPVKGFVSDGRHPQRMAQQRPSAPSKPITSLKNIPLIGPVSSFLGG
jgi:hypothetical protein